VQDSITVMTAYSAVFLLRLLRHSNTLSDLHEEATKKIYDLISQTADVYQEAALMASSSGSAGYHARFLRSLVAKDLADKQRAAERRAHKHRDAESSNSPSQNPASPSLLPSPTNAIPSYHPPQHIPPTQFPTDSSIASGSLSSPVNGSDVAGPPTAFSLAQSMPGAHTFGLMPDSQNSDMQFQQALGAPMQMQDQTFQFSSYARPQQNGTPGGGGGALDFRTYQPGSSWPQTPASLTDPFGQPEYQHLNGVSDADIHYWRHMFVNLGFGNG